MTGVLPSDSDCHDDPALTVELEKPRSFNFESLSGSEHLIVFFGVILISIADRGLRTKLAAFVLEYTFTGKIHGLGGPDGEAMVEYGVSRFKKQVAETDEPLAILALVTFVEEERQTLVDYLTQPLDSANAASRGIAFEPFGAYLFARHFAVPTRLSDVFEFVDRGNKAHKALQDELAELVTLTKDGDNYQITPLRITTTLRSNHILGRSPSTVGGTLKWLENPEGSAFCFPANPVGPDLIFVLRLISDGTLLRISVQFKHTQELSPRASEEAIRTTDPLTFLSRKTRNSNSPVCSDLPMRDRMVEAIKNLGNGTKKAGSCGLLRVMFSHASPPDDDTLEEAAKGEHPVALVPLKHLYPPESDLGQIIASLASMARQRSDQKRTSSDEIEGARPKRKVKELI